jgi:hypothetical protein
MIVEKPPLCRGLFSRFQSSAATHRPSSPQLGQRILRAFAIDAITDARDAAAGRNTGLAKSKSHITSRNISIRVFT